MSDKSRRNGKKGWKLKMKLTKTHPLYVKNTVVVFLLVVKVTATPQKYLYIDIYLFFLLQTIIE